MSSRRQSLAESIAGFFSGKSETKEKRLSATGQVLLTKADRAQVKRGEKERRADFQRKQQAASTIQRAWRKYKRKKKGKPSQQRGGGQPSQASTSRLLRLRAAQLEWEIAALTIQLAWRKFFRRKLLRSLNPNRRLLQMWDPDVVALKQQALIAEIYSEQLMVPFWHPTLKPCVRPFWFHLFPSPAAVSFNFAVDQYHPLRSWQGMRPHSWTGPVNHTSPSDCVPHAPPSSFRPKRSQNAQFSYNLRKT
ncbi:hypothetical protein ACOMHN_031596 [Nucella lapillus]